MAKKGNRSWVWMISKATPFRFISSRNKVNQTEKLEIKHYDPVTKKHQLFREGK